MALPTLNELTTKLGDYVEKSNASNTYVGESCAQAVAFIGSRFDPTLTFDPEGLPEDAESYIVPAIFTRMPQPSYVREVLELGADLFYRRQAKNGIVSVNALEGAIARVSKDPYAASEARLTRFVGLGFA